MPYICDIVASILPRLMLQIESYWTYELCHGKHLRQYHESKELGLVSSAEGNLYLSGKIDNNSSAMLIFIFLPIQQVGVVVTVPTHAVLKGVVTLSCPDLHPKSHYICTNLKGALPYFVILSVLLINLEKCEFLLDE